DSGAGGTADRGRYGRDGWSLLLLVRNNTNERVPSMINRRDALKTLATLPLGAVAADSFVARPLHAVMRDSAAAPGSVLDALQRGGDVYRAIGVEPVINGRGTFTIIGGSMHLPEVGAAMEAAAQAYVQMD